jgi:AraC family transcriptional regulator
MSVRVAEMPALRVAFMRYVGPYGRYDACVVVPREFTPDRLVDVMDVAGGRYAIAQFVGTAHEIESVWDRVFARWLPGSGYQPDDRPCYELYRGDPSVDGRGVFRCALHLPVRPL